MAWSVLNAILADRKKIDMAVDSRRCDFVFSLLGRLPSINARDIRAEFLYYG